jgi:2-polyprenyl-3-methyl-5-hydroxy-6-metoxy-1,4-benzoquinol methylase/RimJ/RimL family protein N-acetyltransferase
VVPEDREIIYAWRNSPDLVERSTSGRTVSRQEHDAWFARLMADSRTLALIVEIDGAPSGQIRLEPQADRCVISAYLVRDQTGKGYGTEAIRIACQMAARRWPRLPIHALVRQENNRGLSGFRKAGFRVSEHELVPGHVTMVLDPSEEPATANHYAELVEKFGHSHLSLNWGSREGQWLRFRILAEISNLNGKSILDVGCGLGHFVDWLAESGIEVTYTGLDLVPELVAEAQSIHPGYEFLQGSILDQALLAGRRFDYVISSGMFATYKQGGQAWVEQCVQRMWAVSREGVAFNTLSDWASDKDLAEHYASPVELLHMAGKLSRWVVLRHDYHPRDCTVYVLRSQRR